MESIVQNPPAQTAPLEPKQAWELVKSQLRAEMARADYETWVLPLFVISYQEQVFTLGVGNAYARDWVEQRLKKRITRLLEGLFNQPIQLRLAVDADQPAAYAAPPTPARARFRAARRRLAPHAQPQSDATARLRQ